MVLPTVTPKLRIAAITDEFSPDLATALEPMSAIGMTGAELRVVFGKNIMDLTDDELDRAIALCQGKGIEILSIASPRHCMASPRKPRKKT